MKRVTITDNMQVIRNKRPLCFYKDNGQDYILCSVGYHLYQIDCQSLSSSYLCKLYDNIKLLISNSSYMRRIFRLGFRSAVNINDDGILLIDRNNFYYYDIKQNAITIVHNESNFHTPLTLNKQTETEQQYYGEYVSIESEISPSIYKIDPDLTISYVTKFPHNTVNHIHYIHYWKEKDALIVLTGDFGENIGVWVYEFYTGKLEPLLTTGQTSRFAWIYYKDRRFYVATDTQLQDNYLLSFIIDIEKKVCSDIKYICPIYGSSIFAVENREIIYFSTTVEPGMPTGNSIKDLVSIKKGQGIHDYYSRIYAYSKLDTQPPELVLCAKKDFLPPRLGQFGTFSFPSGKNSTDYLYAYGIGVKRYNNCLVRIKAAHKLKVSVCMATYNGAKYINEQLDSIMNQSVAVDEICIVDDCSKDNTVGIIQKYKSLPIKIYCHNENKGYVKSFERSIEESSGDICVLCDQDDIWEQNKIETILNYFKSNPEINVIAHNLIVVDANNIPIKQPTIHLKPGLYRMHHLIMDLLKPRYFGCTLSFRSSLKSKYLPFNKYVYTHDHWLAINGYQNGGCFVIEEKLIRYRRHTSTLTTHRRASFKIIIRTRINYLLMIAISYIRKRRNI